MSQRVKWGILGFSAVARESFVPGLLGASNSKLFAWASRSPEKLRDYCRGFAPKTKIYGEYDQLLDDPEVEAVYLPLPNALHKEWTIKAAQKGKHVLCEKPLALNSEDCLQMIEACRQNNVKLMEGFMYRYSDRIRKTRQIIEDNEIGQVKYINSYFFSLGSRASGDRINPSLGGGSLFDLGCYPVNLVSMIAQSEPVSISAEAVPINGVDRLLSAVLRYESGMIANIQCGWVNEFRSLGTTIMGTKGTLTVPEPFWGNPGTLLLRTATEIKEIPVAGSDRFRSEIEDFAAAIRENRSPQLDVNEAINNLKIIKEILVKAGLEIGNGQ